MARMILPERGIDLVTGGFESVLPDGIYLVLRGRQVSARSMDMPPLSEFHAGGVFPFRWLSETSRARAHIGHLCEQIAGSVSGALAGWRSGGPDAWPWAGAKALVDCHDHDVQVTFAGTDERETMRLGEIRWEGPWLVPKGSPLAEQLPPAIRYVGNVPDTHRQADLQRRSRHQ